MVLTSWNQHSISFLKVTIFSKEEMETWSVTYKVFRAVGIVSVLKES